MMRAQRHPELESEVHMDDLMRLARRRHCHNDAVEQLVMALVVRAEVEEFADGQ